MSGYSVHSLWNYAAHYYIRTSAVTLVSHITIQVLLPLVSYRIDIAYTNLLNTRRLDAKYPVFKSNRNSSQLQKQHFILQKQQSYKQRI